MRTSLAVTIVSATVAGALTFAGPGTIADAAASTTNVNDPCFVAHNTTDPGRELTVRRDGTRLHVGFFRTPQDDRLGVVRYETYVVHDIARAKTGDLRVTYTGRCLPNGPTYAYKPEARSVCDTTCTRRTWSFAPTFTGLRDEANGFMLFGFNAAGQRVVARYRAFNERQTGTIWGKVTYLGCLVSASGLPTATSTFLFSRAFVAAAGLLAGPKGRDLAAMGAVALDGLALSMSVDPNTGLVARTTVIKVERARFAESVVRDAVMEWAKEHVGAGGKVVVKPAGVAYQYLVSAQATVANSTAFVRSAANWRSDVAANQALCAMWRG